MPKPISIDELRTRIKSELTVGEKLLALGQTKKDMVVKNDLQEIERINKEETETLEELEELGFERQEWVLKTCKHNRLRVTEKLGDLIHQLPQEELQEEFASLRSRLMKMYQNIAECTKLNGELLSQSMGVSRQLFQRFSHVDRRTKNANYGRFSKSAATANTSAPSFHHKG
jgi:hypothetical protein